MRILLLDNYDSFTYNLAHRLREAATCEVSVVRNDQIDLVAAANFDRIVLSPGPGIPAEAGQMMALIEQVRESHPILGVCLGHQAIAESFGAQLLNLPVVVHGKEHEIELEASCPLFRGIPQRIKVGRYHSWVVDRAALPPELIVTAQGPHQEIMAIRHLSLPIHGVQFHPESIMTSFGLEILRNWMES